ncbi:MFS transporter MCT family solute carrier family 16 (monocarboxylic acid transporters) member 10 [Microdochium nivale]|nr:MFS transporter MCT family solute carrier family 16 (monocarboxylic acid transporters) member 10 [Microdochium nivale]
MSAPNIGNSGPTDFDEKHPNNNAQGTPAGQASSEKSYNNTTVTITTDTTINNNPLIAIRTNQTQRSAGAASSSIRRTTSNVPSAVLSGLTTRDWPEPPPPPDGGLKAWTQVACGWLVLFTTWGYANSFGTFQTYYTTSLAPQGISPLTISWIGSVQVCLILLVGVFSGHLLDVGWFVSTFFVGAAIQVAGMAS